MLRSNRWNRCIYWLWSPVYHFFIRLNFIQSARRQALATLELRPGDRVILPGVGTGADLPLLPEGVVAVGTDLSPAMLGQARKRLPLPAREITLVQGDAESLPFADGSFDAAVLTLILSVVPDGRRCLQEAVRVVRPGGRLLVFDKFWSGAGPVPWRRRLLNGLTIFFGTDINRRFEDMCRSLPVVIESDTPSLLWGAYRVILLRKSRIS